VIARDVDVRLVSRMSGLLNARLASVPLMEVNKHDLPVDAGSSCILDFGEKNILITVQHVPKNGGDWRVLVRQSKVDNRSEQFRPGGFNYLSALNLKKKLKRTDIEFAYVAVPKSLRPTDQIGDEPEMLEAGTPKLILPGEYTQPTADGRYSFYGLTKWEIDDKFRVQIEQSYEDGLTYVGTDKFLHTFRRAEKYFEYATYKGCSGTPIMNQDGKLVSLLIEGTDDKRGFVGINLATVWSALLIEAGRFG